MNIQKWFKNQKKIKEKEKLIKNVNALKIQKWFMNRKKIKDAVAEKFIKENFTVVATNVQRITDAQTVCIAEMHSENVKEISSVFNLLYKKVDVALSELGDVTLNPSIENGSYTLATPYSEYLKKIVKFKSWDHPSKYFASVAPFCTLYEDMLNFKNHLIDYNKFYDKYKNLLSVDSQKQIEKLIRLYETDNSNYKMPGLVETYIIFDLFHLFNSLLWQDIYNTTLVRNTSLCKSLDDAYIDKSNHCKKVFLICGAAHVINLDAANQGVDLVNTHLNLKKYVILRPIKKPEKSSYDTLTFRISKIEEFINEKENQFLLVNAINAIGDQPPISKEIFESTDMRIVVTQANPT